ncbi:hypothetical protein A3K78_07715 [Candidatus Bathyarchaeota archaeon RBG_13_52_12]|nr:MAG: hypothetical protein A3K78_07715 [Candidatus Bathyarchaeota archaeon RBG_13_52_12]
MVKLLIIANDAPYGGEKTWNALRLAGASVTAEVGMQVRVFLMGDSVGTAKKGQVTPEGYYNLEKMLSDLVAKGVEVKTCGTCLKSRGIMDADLVSGVQRGTMMILASWVKESDRIVSF